MTRIEVNTDIADERWQDEIANITELVEKVKSATFNYVANHESLPILQAKKTLVISLCLSDDNTVHGLNKEFRGMDRPTNVLTFANMDSGDFSTAYDCFDEIDLGSIILAYETMVREAEIEQISLEAHFCHLLTHGFLHIIGYDHIKEDEAKQMEGLETAILQTMQIANPYAEDEIG
jgi:probable rRNA maturation factor